MGRGAGRMTALIGVLGVAVLIGAGGGAAQQATPVASPAADAVGLPAHVHRGTCETLDPNPAFPLTDVAVPQGAGQAVGGEGAIPVLTSTTTLAVTLQDLVAQPHAINVHESAQNPQNYIACGNIGGTQVGETLMLGLKELNGSQAAGVAILRTTPNGTEVVVYVAPGAAPGKAPGT